MNENQLSIFDLNIDNTPNNIIPVNTAREINYNLESYLESILLSVLASNSISDSQQNLISYLVNNPKAKVLVSSFNAPQLRRKLNKKITKKSQLIPKLENRENKVIYNNQELGEIKVLYKAPLPGELQAKLAYISAIDRFLEYLQKKYCVIVLDESDYHVRLFIPVKYQLNFDKEWEFFIKNVMFSIYDHNNDKLPRLAQTFVSMLNSITLAGRGFSTLNIPIITEDQAQILATWYFAVFQQVKKRQKDRQNQIDKLKKELDDNSLKDKDINFKQKELQKKEEKQTEEYKKYCEAFQKTFTKMLVQHQSLLEELTKIESQLNQSGLTKSQVKKLNTQKDKLTFQIIFSQKSLQQKLDLLEQSQGDPFKFIELDQKQNNNLTLLNHLAKIFTKTATEQINSTRGDIFSQCLLEMYRLLENPKFSKIPDSLLTEKPIITRVRSPGDDGNKFCYSCGVVLDKAEWQVARFMFERPSQRRQSSSSEDRPYICSNCSVLAFASPLKVTDESIILKLRSKNNNISQYKIKDYLRMLTNKEMHLYSGYYLLLVSDKTSSGDIASHKLGQVQYARAKIADIFPLEVLKDFDFFLILQGSQEKQLESRHLIFIKGLMEGYGQKIINSGKEINLKLGDAIRYIEQDLPYLADYTLAKVSNFSSISNLILLEQVRENYYQQIKGDSMSSEELKKRFNLYKDVAALTGLTYAFANSLESTAKKAMKPEDVEREVSKLIEQVDNGFNFCYYATLGDEKKTNVQARLFYEAKHHFIYEQTQELLNKLEINNREEIEENGSKYIQLYADDIIKAYDYFANADNQQNYASEKDWKTLTYHLKLSLYIRFPELVRKLNK
jgi:hypothetical protein